VVDIEATFQVDDVTGSINDAAILTFRQTVATISDVKLKTVRYDGATLVASSAGKPAFMKEKERQHQKEIESTGSYRRKLQSGASYFVKTTTTYNLINYPQYQNASSLIVSVSKTLTTAAQTNTFTSTLRAYASKNNATVF
jgi:hypothetical protein